MKFLVLYFLILGIFSFQYVTVVALTQKNNSNCTTADNQTGTCVRIDNCPALKSALYRFINSTKDVVAETEEFLNKSTCCWTAMTHERIVCCPPEVVFPEVPEKSKNNLLPNNSVILPEAPNQCGITFTEYTYSRIVGGFKVRKGQFPWMVSIGVDTSRIKDMVLPNPTWSCGGSLITPIHVLTAAHCVHNVKVDFVRINTLNPYHEVGFQGKVIKVFVHENYTAPPVPRPGVPLELEKNDIAVLKVQWDSENVVDLIKQAATINPICLPKSPEMRKNLFERYHPFVAGWGVADTENYKLISEDIDLHAVQLPVWPQKKCRIWLRRRGVKFGKEFRNVLCAGYVKERRDACRGDSGGPLMLPYLTANDAVTRYYQIGIVSQGFGCARPGNPAFYTRVGNYINWIKNKINQ